MILPPTLDASGQVQAVSDAVAGVETVVVWEAADWEPLYSRIRGHTVDLSVSVSEAWQPPIPEEPSVQWRLSRRLAEQYSAEAVVWFDAGAIRQGRVVLRIALPRKQRLLERDLGTVAGASERPKVPSAALEAAAVIVREAVQALLMGEAVGTSGYGRFDDVAEVPAPAPTPASAGVAIGVDASMRADAPTDPRIPAAPAAVAVSAGTQNRSPPPARSHRSNWALGVGLQLSADGFGPLGTTEGLLASVVWRGPALELGAMVNGNLPVSVHSDAGSLRLTRQQASFFTVLPVSTAQLGISVGVRLGPVLYRRDRLTPSQAATARASATHWLGSVGPVLLLRYPARNLRFSTTLALGADVVSHQLELGYQSANEFVVVKRSWPILPFLQLGIAIGL